MALQAASAGIVVLIDGFVLTAIDLQSQTIFIIIQSNMAMSPSGKMGRFRVLSNVLMQEGVMRR